MKGKRSKTKSKPNPFWDDERALWKRPEDLTVSQCADKYRSLSNKAARPGRWDTSFVPFNREIMDAFSQDCVEEIWYVKPTQTGGTDSILNMILYAVMQDPGPAMIVEPNEGLADEISQERIDDMIRSCDGLKEVQSSDQDESTKKKKTFSTMTLYLAWAGSPASLASRPIRYVFFDEVNKYPAFSGKEASPLALGKERTNTFLLTRKLVYVSTPTEENGYISAGEKACDARFRYCIPCPHCGERQQLLFPRVKFGEDHDPKKVEEESWYECARCSARIFESERMDLVRRGKWVDIVSGLDYAECLRDRRPKRIGFQISRLYSPWHSFGMVAAEFLRAKGDPMKLMNWRNSWMAEEWVERISSKEDSDILRHRSQDEPLTVPRGTMALTAGIDPGQGGYWFLVGAWIKAEELFTFHVVDYGFLPSEEILRQMVVERAYPGDGGRSFPVWRAGMDTGGSEYGDDVQTMTESAYNFLRRFGGNRLFGTKGMRSRAGRRMQMSIIDKMPRSNVPIPGGIVLWLIDTDAMKDILHFRLQVNPGSPGGISFHSGTREDLARHILAEEKRRNRLGHLEWVQLSSTNHLLDCLCLALAMGDPECYGGVKVLGHEQSRDPQTPVKVEEIRPDTPEQIQDRVFKPAPRDEGGWMKNTGGWIKK